MGNKFEVGEEVFCYGLIFKITAVYKAGMMWYYNLSGEKDSYPENILSKAAPIPVNPRGGSVPVAGWNQSPQTPSIFDIGDRVRFNRPGTMGHGDEGKITGRTSFVGTDYWMVTMDRWSTESHILEEHLTLISKAGAQSSLGSLAAMSGSSSWNNPWGSLPQGFGTLEEAAKAAGGGWDMPATKAKCVCGITKTMGEGYSWDNHSDWCDVYAEGKKAEKK
jgi:hypothetical protein